MGQPARLSAMHLVMGGIRGAWPVTRPEFAAYGGDTTSFLIQGQGDARIVVDAGTGIRSLAEHCRGPGPVTLLLTHFHYDHLIGLPSFPLMYESTREMVVASLDHGGMTAQQVVADMFRQPFWPVPLAHKGIQMSFVELNRRDASGIDLGGIQVRWVRTPHPGGSTALRFDEPATGASLLLATDIEWSAATPAEREAFLALGRDPGPVDHLVMDGQYEDADLPNHRGWGHSTWQEVVQVARDLGVRGVTLVHHDPALDDDRLAAREQVIRAACPIATLGRQGEEIQIGT